MSRKEFLKLNGIREIKLTHPRLIRIRNNFRRVWDIAVRIKRSQMYDKMDEFEADSKEWSDLSNKRMELGITLEHSILMCCWCGNITGDRIWVESRGKWHCEECFREHIWPDLIPELKFPDKNQTHITDFLE